jgi:hypothetical protein
MAQILSSSRAVSTQLFEMTVLRQRLLLLSLLSFAALC